MSVRALAGSLSQRTAGWGPRGGGWGRAPVPEEVGGGRALEPEGGAGHTPRRVRSRHLGRQICDTDATMTKINPFT